MSTIGRSICLSILFLLTVLPLESQTLTLTADRYLEYHPVTMNYRSFSYQKKKVKVRYDHTKKTLDISLPDTLSRPLKYPIDSVKWNPTSMGEMLTFYGDNATKILNLCFFNIAHQYYTCDIVFELRPGYWTQFSYWRCKTKGFETIKQKALETPYED